MIDQEMLLDDLASFSDLGVTPPKLAVEGEEIVARLIRFGDNINLRFLANGNIYERVNEEPETKHINYKALLASDRFGNLRDWASVQHSVLIEESANQPSSIPLLGFLHSANTVMDFSGVEDELDRGHSSDAARILLIDGPAGIGKTEFIKQLSLKRAASFKRTQKPLVLHVQSRGRVLTFLQDLIAFSLQTLRLRVTYDQVPILVRNGLVTIAIDGFDELGDPSGYETAWAQVGDLINQVRGEGTLILAGRETFIGRDRLVRDIKALKKTDIIDSVTLQSPSTEAAFVWLKQQGWTDERLKDLDELLQPGSFALRPIFLRHLGETGVVGGLSETEGSISNLINLMIDRETGKFGEPVERVLTEAQRQKFVLSFLGEIARDMADNQTESADETTIKWAAEATLNDSVPEDINRLLQNRALVMAFLTSDERPRYRRFSHSQLQNYFLGLETISLIKTKEVPKFLRRNLLSADFLVTFSNVLNEIAKQDKKEIIEFMESAFTLLNTYSGTDRGTRNLSALLLCCAPFSDLIPSFGLKGQQIDDALIRGIASSFTLKNCTVNQLDVREADITNVVFDECIIGGLILDERSKINMSIQPSYIQMENESGNGVSLISDPEEIAKLLRELSTNICGETIDNSEPSKTLDHPIFKLLDRAIRYRGYWFREDGDDVLAKKITDDALWPALSDLLLKHDFLRKEERVASGRPSYFFHIKRPQLLQKISSEPDTAQLLSDVEAYIIETSA